MGGESAMPAAHGEVEELNTLDGTFSTLAPLLQERHAAAAPWIDGKLYTALADGLP
jgi:hypothetical protein